MRAANIRFSLALLSSPLASRMTPTNPLAFLSVSSERRVVARERRALLRRRSRERLGRLRGATHPFAFALSYVLGTSVPGPLNRAEACKENDVREAVFSARLFLPDFYQSLFPSHLAPVGDLFNLFLGKQREKSKIYFFSAIIQLYIRQTLFLRDVKHS